MSKKLSPLQRWKAEYNYVTRQIGELKKSYRAQGAVNRPWGSFKLRRAQSRIEFLRSLAREKFAEREERKQEAQKLWEDGSNAPTPTLQRLVL